MADKGNTEPKQPRDTADPGKQDKQKQIRDKQDKRQISQREENRTESAVNFPIVAIGASAGGIHALQDLFNNLPTETGMAFVVILHLSKEHKSNLPQLLAQCTDMPVQSAENNMTVAANQVYVIPADRTLTIEARTLKLSERERAPGKFKPIDAFFKSLAEHLQEKAIGIVLSGTGTDGTFGVRAIKAGGGLTFAQSEESAEFAEMPRHAIESGQVDLVLDADQIGRELKDLLQHPHLRLPPDRPEGDASEGWEHILESLKGTGIDFSQYKQSTVRRRISRRMAINKIDKIEDYGRFLDENPEELKALREDLLIKVTEFFRDPETFEALKEKVFARIARDKDNDEPIRIWIPGCATGEEVYSLAIALSETLGEKSTYTSAQLFGTDVSDNAIETARQGYYTQAQVEGISETGRRKFFTEADGGFQVKKHLREMCIFARQDFTKDPPFSRMDLVSCRNVLIYFGANLQKKVIPLFHYALNPNGFLLLGASESIGQFEHLFRVVDKKRHIYAKKANGHPIPTNTWPSRKTHPQQPKDLPQQEAFGDRKKTRKNLQQEVDSLLVQRFDPAAVVVDEDLEIVQFRGETAPFLAHPPGKASLNLLQVVRDSLRLALRNLIERAKKQQSPQKEEAIAFLDERGQSRVALEVSPFRYEQTQHFLVRFERSPVPDGEKKTSAAEEPATSTPPIRQEMERLKKELATNQEYTRSVVDEKNEALEDLKAANEEILSSNEELQSLNEELETAKEEIESSNEELTTVNLELQNRNEQLSRAHNDLNNLILSAQIPFLIVTDDLKIRRVSPNAEQTFNVTPHDVGRSVADLKLSFELPDFEEKLLRVIHTGDEVEHEIQDRSGRWHLVRVRPYQSEHERAIEGAVLTLFDIDRLKRSMEEVEKAHKYALRIVDAGKDPLIVLDKEMRVKTANPAFYEKFQVGPKETEGERLFELGAGQWDRPELRRLLQEILPRSTRMDNYHIEFDFPHLGPRTMMLSARKMQAAATPHEAILLSIEDVTDQRQLEEYLRRAKQQAEEASRSKSEFLANISHEIRTPMTVILSSLQLLEGTDLDNQQKQCRDMASRSTASLLELLDDLLDFSKIEADRVKIHEEPFDLRENVEDAVNILRAEAESKGLALNLKLSGNLPQAISGDRKRLRQVLVNLVGNAIKFTEEGEIRVEVKSSEDSPPASGVPVVLFSIQDTGIGIPAEQIERLFQRFTQLDGSTTRKYGGTGLGLSICKGLIERMGGAIWVESREGEGSTFFFTIPLIEAQKPHRKPDAEETGKATERPSHPESDNALKPILLGEDDPDIRHLVGLMLRDWGWTVIAAGTGRELLEKLRSEEPQLVLLDLQMPEMDGLTTAREIRRDPKGETLPIIGLTAHVRAEDREKCLEAGMDDVLTKPIDFEQLQAKILYYLEG